MKMYKYAKEGGKPQIMDIPADQKDQAEELHSVLIERAAESDESLMEQFFANDTLTPEELQKGNQSRIDAARTFPYFLRFRKKEYGRWPAAGIHFPGSTRSQ